MQINQEMPFVLFPNCIIVKGYTRSIIIDLHKKSFKFIPNVLGEILDLYNGFSVRTVKANYDLEYHALIDEYFKYLVENQLLFFSQNSPGFSKLNKQWIDPSVITNATIDIDDEFPFPLLLELSQLNCIIVSLRFKKSIKKDFLLRIVEIVDQLRISELHVTTLYDESCRIDGEEILSVSVKLKHFVFLNAPENKEVYYGINSRYSMIYLDGETSKSLSCGKISPSYFASTRQHVLESLQFNTCLYKKVYIDSVGNVKNCPYSEKGFGNVSDECLTSIVAKSEFRELWFITKDLVDVCSDCEFRCICMDCRVFTETQEVRNAKPKYCNYNPYIAKWAGQDGFVSVDYWRQNNCNQTN